MLNQMDQMSPAMIMKMLDLSQQVKHENFVHQHTHHLTKMTTGMMTEVPLTKPCQSM